ncbi:MAG: ABC transporter ATP-binding protein [Bacteroidota bacterium]
MNLTIQNISKSFSSRNDRIDALKNISFNVASGEFVCLLGPSGCGKSTLLNIIAGLEQPDSGFLYCDGRVVTTPSTDRIVIFQEPALFPWLRVVENVEFGLTVNKMPPKKRREVAQRFLSMVHLSRFQHAAIHELSGGMKQRVALARALALDPAVLLMDEPFGALDAQTRDLLHIELQEIWESTKKTVVFVTHNVREAIRLGDRVLVMSARPGFIKREFIVNLPRPRQMEDHGLVDTARLILAELRDEVNRALAEEVNGEA